MAMTFEQMVESVRQFPAEQQEMLIDLMRGWRIEARRREMYAYLERKVHSRTMV